MVRGQLPKNLHLCFDYLPNLDCFKEHRFHDKFDSVEYSGKRHSADLGQVDRGAFLDSLLKWGN
jgi:hypothetical protein